MKKIISAILAMVLCIGLFAACGNTDKGPQLSIEQLYKANSLEELLKQGEVVHLTVDSYTDYEFDYETFYSKDSRFKTIKLGNVLSAMLTTADGDYDYTYDESTKEEDFYKRVYFMGPEDEKEYRQQFSELKYFDDTFLSQVIKDVRDNGDGTYSVIAEYNTALLFDDQYVPEEYEGGNVRSEMTVNKDTLMMTSCTDSIITKDGSVVPYGKVDIAIEDSMPELHDRVMDLAMNVGKYNPRTVTLIYDPGTENETAYEVTLDKQTHCYMFILENYLLFRDPDGTEEFYSDRNAPLTDVTLYAIPRKGLTLSDFMGAWSDTVTGQASMEITTIDKGTDAHISIWWASAENESTNWEFDAVYDKEETSLSSENGVRKVLKYVDGEEKEEIIAENIITEIFFNASNDLVLWCEDEDASNFIFVPYAF